MCQQTDPVIPVLVSAATQTEETEPSVVESPVVPGTCLVADVMQTEDPFPSDAHLPSDQDAFLSAATDAEPWQAPPRRRKCHRQKVASTLDDDDDDLLNAAITSVAQERNELANTVSRQVDDLQRIVRRVGLVCPRPPGRHHVVARAVTDATDTRCLRCNTLPAVGEV